MVTLSPPRNVRSAAESELGPYWEQFDRLTQRSKESTRILAARRAGMARFAEMGFPTLQDEDWRFTNVAPIARLPFQPVFESTVQSLPPKALQALIFNALPGTRLVFLDGHFAPQFSTMAKLPAGAKVMTLGTALATDVDLVEKYLFRHARMDANSFVALNTAFFQDGAFIYVPPDQVVTDPIQLIFLSTRSDAGAAIHPRNLIIAERRAQVTVVENFASVGPAAGLTNSVTELIAGDNAKVEHLKVQDQSETSYHLATLAAHFGRGSNVVTHSVALGARLSRTHLYTKLAGEGLECILNGLYLTRGEQLADHYMVVEHDQPHCASHEYFNGILADRSKGVFHGRILVQPGAQKTDAKQTNKNLLLSDDATADTKPQLEIYADDVKCTHGATIGQLNEESIFYLRARGIPREKARRMLIHAFAGEIIDRIRHEALRAELDQIVWDRLEQNEGVAVGS